MDYDVYPIQVFTQYSYEQMKAFQRFHYRKMRRSSTVLISFFLLIFAISLVSISLYDSFLSALAALFPLLFWIAVLSLPLLVFSGAFYTRKVHANATKLIQNGQNYSFCNNDYALSTEQQDNIWQSRTAYSVILNAWETRDMFYLYTGKNQAHLIDKQGFQTGSPDELRALLQNHIPPKNYKKYKI